MDAAQQESTSIIQSIPRVTRVLAVLLAVATGLTKVKGVGQSVVDNFALRPMSTIGASKVWNVVSAGFVELNPAKSLVNILLFLTTGKWIETSWGARLFILFLLFVNFVAGVFTYVAMLAAFFATRIDSFLFAPIGTTNGICAALLVAVKQVIPEHEIGVNGMNISVNYLPLVYVTVMAVLTVLQQVAFGELFFTITAFQFSWLYLRYYQTRNGNRGDMSEQFAYATMFPEPIRTVVAIFANFGYIMFRPILMAGRTAEQTTEPPAPAPMTKAASIDAERRRQRALKALDERMSANAKAEEGGENQV